MSKIKDFLKSPLGTALCAAAACLLAVVLGGNSKDRRDSSARRLIEAGFRHPSSPKQVQRALGRRR